MEKRRHATLCDFTVREGVVVISDNLSDNRDFSISLLIFQFSNSALKLRRNFPFSRFAFFLSCCCAIRGCLVLPLGVPFATPRCVGDRFSMRSPRLRHCWLHLWKKGCLEQTEIAALTDWLSVCLSVCLFLHPPTPPPPPSPLSSAWFAKVRHIIWNPRKVCE